MRSVRGEGTALARQGVGDEAETSEAQIRDDIEFALLQMESETLSKIDEALARLRAMEVVKKTRSWQRPSDHVPIVLDLD